MVLGAQARETRDGEGPVRPVRLVRGVAGLLPALMCMLALLAACGPLSGAHTLANVATPTPTARVTEPVRIGRVGPIGPLDPARTLDVSFVLRARGNLSQRAAAAGDPQSPGYHQYLTPAQIAQQYGPDPADVARTAAVLRANGLDITAPTPDGVLLSARGTVGRIEQLLGIHLIQYRESNGELSFASDGAPYLPASFGGAVTGVLGLDTRTHIRTGVSLAPSTLRQTPGVAGFTPATLESAYDLGPLHQAGRDGSGQTIALAEIDTFNSADVQSYDQVFGISAPALQVIKVNGGATARSPEPVLDIEVVRAIAPRANVLVYESPEDLLSVARMLSQIVSDNRAKVISVSLGTCERGLDPSIAQSFLSSLNNTFQRAAAQGISALVASGDSGAYDCQDNALSVGALAANPYVTAVGGTALFLTGGRYASEAGWEGPLEAAGSGGGVSVIYKRPSWQSGSGVANQYSTGMRQVPDVSANADPLTGYLIYYTTHGCRGESCWQIMGGTSAATPLWAALIVLANQQAQAGGKAPLGFLNPALYRLGSGAGATDSTTGSTTGPVYHDVTRGGNLYYAATAGWDYCTGWGSPDGARLVRALLALG